MISPTRPLTTSLIACAGPPVYGTVNSLISPRLCKSSAVRCVSLPTPVTAQDIAPERAFAWAMRSEILLMPSEGLATTNMGFSAAKPIAVKSCGSRIGTLGAGPGSATKLDSTGMIHRKNLLAPHLAEPIGNHPQHGIWCAARSGVRDNCYRFVRIFLALRLHLAGDRCNRGRSHSENCDAHGGATQHAERCHPLLPGSLFMIRMSILFRSSDTCARPLSECRGSTRPKSMPPRATTSNPTACFEAAVTRRKPSISRRVTLGQSEPNRGRNFHL